MPNPVTARSDRLRAMTLIKTYRRDEDGILFYREAWKDGSAFFRHEGKAGTKGKRQNRAIQSRTRPDKPTLAEYVRAFKEEAAADGFAEIPEDAQGWVVLQVWTRTADLSDPRDAWLLDEGQEALDDHLGWLGLGHVDGNDLGGTPPDESGANGTVLNLFCKVVDTTLGVKAVRSFATRHDLPPDCVIAAREAGDDTDYVLAWTPRRSIKTFHL